MIWSVLPQIELPATVGSSFDDIEPFLADLRELVAGHGGQLVGVGYGTVGRDLTRRPE